MRRSRPLPSGPRPQAVGPGSPERGAVTAPPRELLPGRGPGAARVGAGGRQGQEKQMLLGAARSILLVTCQRDRSSATNIEEKERRGAENPVPWRRLRGVPSSWSRLPARALPSSGAVQGWDARNAAGRPAKSPAARVRASGVPKSSGSMCGCGLSGPRWAKYTSIPRRSSSQPKGFRTFPPSSSLPQLPSPRASSPGCAWTESEPRSQGSRARSRREGLRKPEGLEEGRCTSTHLEPQDLGC